MGGLSSLAGGRVGALAIVRSPARLRRLLGPTKASAAAAAGDLVVTFSVDDVDPAVVSQILNTTWGQEVGSGTVDQQMVNTVNVNKNEYGDNGLTPQDAPGTTITTSVNPNAVSSTNITIDVPVGDVTGQSSLWLSGFLATVLSTVAYFLAAAVCFAAFAPVVGATAGTFTPFALRICGGVSNGIGTLVWFLVGRGFSCGWTTTCFGNPTFLAVTFCSSLVSAIAGVLGFLPALAAGPLRKATIYSAGKLKDMWNWLLNFFTVTIPKSADALGSALTNFGNKIMGAFRQSAAEAGQPTGQAPVPLQPMAMGDSITDGYQSSDGSGYRCNLQSYLDNSADTYQFVGSLSNGTCPEPFDNGGSFWPQNEGHSGWTIAQLQSIESCTIKGYEPNVVFLDIGTNDVNRGGDPNTAAAAEENLINSIFADDPGVTVIVGSLIPTGTYAANMVTFNNAVSSWISGSSAHVVYADMRAVEGFDLADGLHPNDAGYEKMAFPWLAALDTAIINGWLHAPNTGSGGGCGGSWTPGVWYPQGTIASGPGYTATNMPGNLTVGQGDYVTLADMNGDGRTDLVLRGGNGSLTVWLNGGTDSAGLVNWISIGTIASGVGDVGGQIRLADINGDGKADYLEVAPDSSVTAWLNGGPGCGNWCWYPQGKIAGGVGVLGDQVSFADMNGDGKADYLVTSGGGKVTAWLNGGSGCGSWCWTPAGVIASGTGTFSNPVFPDLNGDGLADYVDVQSDGSIVAYVNPGLSNLTNGIGWIPEGTILSGTGVGQEAVQFGDINGNGNADYLAVDQTNGAVTEWENDLPTSGAANGWPWSYKGRITSGAFSYKIQFADLNADKKADYLVVNSDSSVKMWYNGGQNASAQNGWSWTGPINLATGVGDPGTQIQFADINGDGYADYLDVDAKTGAVKAWLSGGGVTWYPQGTIASGLGDPGEQIRFADINGDGRADYLDVHPDSSVTAYINGGQNASAQNGWLWIAAGAIATGVGVPGTQIQFADMNGDGKADYLNINPDSSIQMWLNGGPNASAQDGWLWISEGTVATGVGVPGGWIHLADVNGDHKADYLSVNPLNGATQVWLNGG